jgi:hypothetical protein
MHWAVHLQEQGQMRQQPGQARSFKQLESCSIKEHEGKSQKARHPDGALQNARENCKIPLIKKSVASGPCTT